MKKNITVLGSTGSIGTQSLEVAKHLGINVVSIAAGGSRPEKIVEQALMFRPNLVGVRDEENGQRVKKSLLPYGIKVLTGENGICEAATEPSELVISAIVGNAGIKPTFAAIDAGIDIALANKETLVSAGELFLEKIEQAGLSLIPVDSEHSAIFQALRGRDSNSVRRIILTASGGPFRGRDREFLKTVTPEMAVAHPTWNMGGKISVDSATLMNKGLEVIEAKLLFGVDVDKIAVTVHPQSIVHSAVEFEDGSVIAQMGTPDMRTPIQYAITFPQRTKALSEILDLSSVGTLTFEQADRENFSCLDLAYKALKKKGTATCALNAANEVAVNAFLNRRISFTDIPVVIEKVIDNHNSIFNYSFEELMAADEVARIQANAIIDTMTK